MSRALKDAEKRLKAEPNNLGLRVQVAGLMREAGRSTEAVELYRSVALAYRDQGRKNQAIMVCRSILEIAPDDVACNALLSQLAGEVPAPRSSAPSIPPSNPSVPTLRPRTVTPSSGPPIGRTPTPSRPPLQPTPQPGPPARPPVTIQPQPSRTSSQSLSKTPSRPPIVIPPKDPSKTPSRPPGQLRPRTPSRPQTEVPAAASRTANDPPPPAASGRLPLEPPARRSSGQTTNPSLGRISPTTNPDLMRRSSGELTPLPKAVPHHIYDPTNRHKRVSADDIDTHDTNPDANPRARTPTNTGLAEAARKITGLINRDEDVANPMDTRPVRKIRSEELRKITHPPPTGEHQRLSEEEILTQPHDALTKPGPGDDELTTPRDLIDDED